MELTIDFPGGAKVEAHFENFSILTDQPLGGGGIGSAPTPFMLFLASIATCAGFYILGFCRSRGLLATDIHVIQRAHRDPESGLVSEVELEIQVPPDFPLKYYDSLVRSANQCAVKKQLENPPAFKIFTTAAA